MARMVWEPAPDISPRIREIVEVLGMAHIDAERVVCLRSTGSKARFLARIWPLATVWQVGLGLQPHYAIEVKHERFDKLSRTEQDRVLIHELLHIPRTFSGAVLPHRHAGGRIDALAVERHYARWERERRLASRHPSGEAQPVP